jgi:pimeloyl-ACP methyl ester carboxylesterase
MSALIDLSLPVGIRSRHVQIATGLNMHILEAGEPDGRPLVLLLHGFPELAYSWREVMTPLAGAGYYVVAPDQRGYGRTTGWVEPAWHAEIRQWSRSTGTLSQTLYLVLLDTGSQ